MWAKYLRPAPCKSTGAQPVGVAILASASRRVAPCGRRVPRAGIALRTLAHLSL
ncbi:MAG: hypothetical protein V4724_02615 [Pseudomonadota bacterium]